MSNLHETKDQQYVSVEELKLIAGPDAKGVYVFEDNCGVFRLFHSGNSHLSFKSNQEILSNGRWVGPWQGKPW